MNRLYAAAAVIILIAATCAWARWRDCRDNRRLAVQPPSWLDCPDCVTGDHGRLDCDEHAAQFTLAVADMTGGTGPLARTCPHSYEDAPCGVIGCTCEVTP